MHGQITINLKALLILIIIKPKNLINFGMAVIGETALKALLNIAAVIS